MSSADEATPAVVDERADREDDVVLTLPGPPAEPEPVRAPERILPVDMLRGFALLGILAMNIVHFAWPLAGYSSPEYSGTPGLANRISWVVSEVVFSGKMMSLFSMLFGAGLVLMNDRAEARGASIRGVYYRRILWLLVIGLVHAYLIWDGDILVAYALLGLILYPLRKLSPRTLIVLGVALTLMAVPIMVGLRAGLRSVERRAREAAEARAAGTPVTDGQREVERTWLETRAEFAPTPEQYRAEVEAMRGGYLDNLRMRARRSFQFQFIYLPLIGIWMVGGRMLLGMGLMKLGVFAATRPPRFYRDLMYFGFGLGIPLALWACLDIWQHGFELFRMLLMGWTVAYPAMLLVALGHVGLVMRLAQTGALPGLMTRLAAVGRMALTNYLMQSLICSTIFYGPGLGLYARIDRVWLWPVVLGIWAFQLWLSPIWLARFRYGPMEWVWRSLTYGRLMPWRYEGGPAAAGAVA